LRQEVSEIRNEIPAAAGKIDEAKKVEIHITLEIVRLSMSMNDCKNH
jgi:hypothetical protein